MLNRPSNVMTLTPLLAAAKQGGYAVGSFSPRNTAMIPAVLKAAQAMDSPLIVQVSEIELNRHKINIRVFADTFYDQVRILGITAPVALHLDHTYKVDTILEAIDVGFTSVMIDASSKTLDENIMITSGVVKYAHQYGVTVEAELGRIGTTDFVETTEDIELYTDPDEAETFVSETAVDALAISVGTAHGVYKVRQPTIDFARVMAIDSRTQAFLVLHGGSGVPAIMMQEAIRLGITKVNIATDLEMAALTALGHNAHLTDDEMNTYSAEAKALAHHAIGHVVEDKIQQYLGSCGRASDKRTEKE